MKWLICNLIDRVSGAWEIMTASAPSLEGEYEQEYLLFWERLVQVIVEQSRNRERVYSLLQDNLGLIDQKLVQLIRDWIKQRFAQRGLVRHRALGAFCFELGDIFQEFDQGNLKVNIDIAVLSYQFCTQIRLQPRLQRNFFPALRNLGNAYRLRAEMGINSVENLNKAIAIHKEAIQLLEGNSDLKRDLLSILNNLGVLTFPRPR